MQLSGYGLLRILLLRTGVKIDSAAAHFQGFGVALARPWNTGVNIALATALFSWLRGGPARAMGHWCENILGGSSIFMASGWPLPGHGSLG
jgi:hypothetical protein